MLRTLLVLMVLGPGLVMALRDRFAALLVYWWFAFFRPQDWIWIDISSLRLSLLIGLILVVPSIFSGLLPNLTHVLSLGNLLFLGLTLVAQVNAVDQAIGWAWVDFLARLTLVCLLTVTLVTTPRRLILLLTVIAASIGFHATKAGVVSLFGGGVRFFDGLAGAFSDNNGYALGTVMMMPFLLAVAGNAHIMFGPKREWMAGWFRRGALAAVPMCALTVISTFSRGAFLALVAATLVYVSLHQRRIRLSLALATLTLLVLAYAPIPEGYGERLATIATYNEIGEQSALGRLHLWQVAVKMAESEPFGVGLRNYEPAYNAYDFSYGQYGVDRAAHSSHLQVLAELGYPGAVVWILQFSVAFAIVYRIRRRSHQLAPVAASFVTSVANCLVASMVAFLVGGSFVSLAVNDLTWLTFAMLAALDRMVPALAAGKISCDDLPAKAPPPVRRAWRPPVRAASGCAQVEVP